MKKFAFSLLLLLGLVTVAHAQIKPVGGDMGLGFRISGLQFVSFEAFSQSAFGSPELLYRYYLSDRIAIRTTLGVNMGNVEKTDGILYIDDVRFSNPTQIDSQVISKVSTMTISLRPGIEYHLLSQATKLDPYVGAVVDFAYLGTTTTNDNIDYTRTDLGIAKITYQEKLAREITEKGGIQIGLSLLAGFNYFFSDNFAIGAEYGLGIASTSQGGEGKITTTGTIQTSATPTDVVVVDEQTTFQDQVSSFTVGVKPTGGINISIFW